MIESFIVATEEFRVNPFCPKYRFLASGSSRLAARGRDSYLGDQTGGTDYYLPT